MVYNNKNLKFRYSAIRKRVNSSKVYVFYKRNGESS